MSALGTDTDLVAGVDAGGTNFRCAVYRVLGDGKLVLVAIDHYPSHELKGIEDGLIRFFHAHPDLHVRAIGCAVAGPVVDNAVTLTNLNWTCSHASVAAALGLPAQAVFLCNDMDAIANGIDLVDAEHVHVIGEGTAERCQQVAVVAAGTGLGLSGRVWVPQIGRYVTCCSEGGHAAWGPNGLLQTWYHGFLSKKHPHISRETVLSGRGVQSAFDFICATGPWQFRQLKTSVDVEVAGGQDAGHLICQAAIEGHEAAKEALALFVDIYGAVARDHALSMKAARGVYLAGGIAPKIEAFIREGDRFMKAFRGAGLPASIAALLQAMPVSLVTDDHVGLLGAAGYAAALPA